jgi:hypothetical protein
LSIITECKLSTKEVMDHCSPTYVDLQQGMVVQVPCIDPNSRTTVGKKSQVTIVALRPEGEEADVDFKGTTKTVPFSEIDFGWRFTDDAFQKAKKHAKQYFPGKMVSNKTERNLFSEEMKLLESI